MLCVKIMLIVNEAPLAAFAWAVLFDIVLAAMGFLYMYHRTTGELLRLHFSPKGARKLLKDSFPCFCRPYDDDLHTHDQVMLGQMAGDGVVGIYSAAAKIAEFWYVFPIMLLQSLYPGAIAAKSMFQCLYQLSPASF